MKGFTSKIVHSDRQGDVEHGSMHKPVHSTVAYGYDDAHDLAAVFQGTGPGFTYSRQVNPTVEALQAKITAMEQGVATLCFATGMAAIGTLLFALLRKGDHFVASSFLFGNTTSLFLSFAAHGVEVTFVDATDAGAVDEAVQDNTSLVFVETIANPRTQVTALTEIGALCAARNLIYVVDNTMTSPYLFQPAHVAANLVVNSLTKYIGGHGNALGGALTEMGSYDWRTYGNILEPCKVKDPAMWALTQVKKKGLRDFGASLAPEAAHHIAVGAETLALRMERQCASSRKLCEYLDGHASIRRVYYPGLPDHPQHERAQALFRNPGALFSFEPDPGVDIWAFMNRLQIVVKSTNLGDNRTLAIPVAHTIYHEVGPEWRARMGIADSLIRISVGIEECDDLVDDFRQALE